MRGSLRTARWPSSCRAHLVFAPIMKMFTRDGDYHHRDAELYFYHRAHYDFQSPGLCSDYEDVPIQMVMIIDYHRDATMDLDHRAHCHL